MKHALVAKFSGGRPPIQELRQCFSSTWKPSGRCSIGALDAKHILIVLETEADARKVLSHPLRKIGLSLFRIFRWSQDFSTSREPTSTTAWVRLMNLPPSLTNPGYIEAIVSSFGRFLAVDNRTRQLTNPNYARVCMELDMLKGFPEEIWISTGADSGFWQKIVYENRLDYCTNCKLHGHSIQNCRKVKLRREAEHRIWDARDEFGLPVGLPSTAMGTGVMSQSKAKKVNSAATFEKEVPWQTVQNRRKKSDNTQRVNGAPTRPIAADVAPIAADVAPIAANVDPIAADVAPLQAPTADVVGSNTQQIMGAPTLPSAADPDPTLPSAADPAPLLDPISDVVGSLTQQTTVPTTILAGITDRKRKKKKHITQRVGAAPTLIADAALNLLQPPSADASNPLMAYSDTETGNHLPVMDACPSLVLVPLDSQFQQSLGPAAAPEGSLNTLIKNLSSKKKTHHGKVAPVAARPSVPVSKDGHTSSTVASDQDEFGSDGYVPDDDPGAPVPPALADDPDDDPDTTVLPAVVVDIVRADNRKNKKPASGKGTQALPPDRLSDLRPDECLLLADTFQGGSIHGNDNPQEVPDQPFQDAPFTIRKSKTSKRKTKGPSIGPTKTKPPRGSQ
ncbi:unnamed protein product [Rhodiola kirilowii]